MCNRTEIVTNGCSGSCCEKFGFPYSLQEIKDMQSALDKSETTFIDRNGEIRNVGQPYEDIPKLIDMLIPLEYSNISETSGLTLLEYFKERCPDKEPYQGALNNCDLKEDGQLYGHYHTCRHFDTVNRICTNYENRPSLCKRYGEGCEYKGCNFTSTLKKLQQIGIEVELS